ncbi:MAG: cobalt ECF transporter T component CbiQ [Thermoanaerobacteraceae bacterium]|nr:cobalt ECF transporter T component CbiQ [Thermoanaerobacteraceae bacterium]
MFKIDHFAYTNRLKAVHPAEKFGFAMITLSLCVGLNSLPVSVATLTIMSFAVVVLAGTPWRFYVKLLTLPLGFLLMGIVAVVFSVSSVAAGYLWGFHLAGVYVGVTEDSLYFAVQLFFKVLGAVSCLYFLALTTPLTDILQVLRKLRVPPLFLELMMLIYRFIFVLLETAGRIHLSQSSRWGYATITASYRSLAGLIANLFARAYWRSQVSFHALLSRGYTGRLEVLESDYRLSWKNITVITAVDMLLAVFGLYGRGII